MDFVFKPFDTIPPGDRMMLTGLGVTLLATFPEFKELRERRRYFLTADNINGVVGNMVRTADINFIPRGQLSIWKRLNVPVSDNDFVMAPTDLEEETIVFDCTSGIPEEPIWDNHFGQGTHVHVATYLPIVFDERTAMYLCQGQPGMEAKEFFTVHGEIKGYYLEGVLRQYEDCCMLVPVGEPEAIREVNFFNWLLMNALLANYGMTVANFQ